MMIYVSGMQEFVLGIVCPILLLNATALLFLKITLLKIYSNRCHKRYSVDCDFNGLNVQLDLNASNIKYFNLINCYSLLNVYACCVNVLCVLLAGLDKHSCFRSEPSINKIFILLLLFINVTSISLHLLVLKIGWC